MKNSKTNNHVEGVLFKTKQVNMEVFGTANVDELGVDETVQKI